MRSAITVEATENGTVAADKAEALAGETVTLTITPAEGYMLNTLTVMQGETEIEVVNNRFIMPDGLPSVFPSIRVFSSELVFCIRCPKYWSSVSASVLLINIQG